MPPDEILLYPFSSRMLQVMNTAVTRNDWVGRVIDGRFPLLEWLGNTEQAGVFRTELGGPQPGRAVIRLVAAEDADARLRDWKQAATLSHPNLMRILDSGRTVIGGVELLYVVTEFADESLSQVIPERPLSGAEATEMLVPVVDALAHLHSRGLVHGHIKPSNIMVVGDRLKLPVETLRRAGPIGPSQSPQQIYDAPEIALGALLPASDVWSLGVTLVEAMTQRPPSWDRSTYADPAVPAEVPEPFAGIARACLRYDAARRATPANIRTLLIPPPSHEEPANEVDLAAPAAMAAPALPGERASRTRLAAIGAAVIVVLAVIVYFLTRSHAPQPAAPVAKAPATAAPGPAITPAPTRPPVQQSPQPSGGTVQGEVAKQAMPNVAASANRTIHGKVDVAVRVKVNPSGTVDNAVLESRAQSRYFTAKALEAARKWTFKPAQQDGHAVASVWTLRFRFTRGGAEVHAVPVSP